MLIVSMCGALPSLDGHVSHQYSLAYYSFWKKARQ
jgi:hypothetical protein